MRCIEVLHNGKRLCVIGHEKAEVIQVNLAYVKRGDTLALTTYANVQQTPELQEWLSWLDERPEIRVGDTIEFRVSDDLVPDPGRLSASFGKRDKDGKQELFCSFCGKSQHEVRKLVAGPQVFICNECIQLCNDIVQEHDKPKDAAP